MQRHYYLLAYICAIVFSTLWGCDKNNDDPNNNTPGDTTIVADNEVTFKVNGGPSTINGKTVFFTNFFLDETHAGRVDSLNATILEAVALWDNNPVYLNIMLPDTIAKFYKFEETFPPTFPTVNKQFEIIINGFPLQQIAYVNIKITEYGAVGGRIKGTINAKMYDYSQGAEAVVFINEGEFNFLRTQ